LQPGICDLVSCASESQLDQGCLSRKGKSNILCVNLAKVYLGVSNKFTQLHGIKLAILGKPHSLIQRHSRNLCSPKVKSQLTGILRSMA